MVPEGLRGLVVRLDLAPYLVLPAVHPVGPAAQKLAAHGAAQDSGRAAGAVYAVLQAGATLAVLATCGDSKPMCGCETSLAAVKQCWRRSGSGR